MTLPKWSWVLFLALTAANSLTAAEITPSPALTSSPSGTTTTGPSIVGDWVGTYRNGDKYFLTFTADQTVTWTIEAKTESSGARPRATVQARYRLDHTTKPGRIDIFDSDSPELLPRGKTLRAPFEFQGDSQLKIDLSEGANENPEKGITDSAVVFSRATSPVVAPPGKMPAVTNSSITGDWTSTAPSGMVISFSFKEDGTLLWVIEAEKAAKSTHAKYRLDASTQPKIIEMYDFEEGDNKGERLRGVFELQSDGRLKLDFVKDPKAPALKDFSKDALVFSKATSPVVRPDTPAAPTSTP